MTWPTTPARFVLTEVDERGLRDGEDGELLSVSEYRGVVPRSTSASQQAASEDTSHYKRCEPHQLVLNRLWAFRGGLGVSPRTGLVSPDYAVFDIDSSMDPRFVHYLMRSSWFVAEMTKRLRGIGDPAASNGRAPRINTDDLGRIAMFAPPSDVQREVAGMLDRENARIDRLIAKNERVIAMVRLRSSAVIDASLGRGSVDRHGWCAPPSWPRVPIRSLTDELFTDGDWVELPHITDSGVRLIQTGNVGVGTYREQGFRYVSEASFDELRCTEVRPGDILICRLADPVGRACLAPDLGVRMITSVDVTIVRPRAAVHGPFVVGLLSTPRWLQRLSAMSQGGTRDRIPRLKLGELRVPLPDVETQVRLAAEWAEEQAMHNRLIESVGRQINLLELRRRSLITAAVTGQLTV